MKRLVTIPYLLLLISCVLFHAPSLKAETEFEKGVSLLKQQQYDDAIAAFSISLASDPNDFEAYHNRGVAWFYKGEYDKAIDDYTRALEINPNRAETYHNRGGAWFYKSNYDQAVSDYTQGLEIAPNDSEAYNNRGAVWYYKGDYGKAIADHARASEINPESAEAYQQMAWILATCPAAEYRDGKKAVDTARKAAALKPHPNILDTLAAAYAEAGQFEDAVMTQKEAIALLKEGGKTQILPKYGKRLEVYENQQPWRDKAIPAPQDAPAESSEVAEAEPGAETVQPDQKDEAVQEEPEPVEPIAETSGETVVIADAEVRPPESEGDGQVKPLPDEIAAEDIELSETEVKDETAVLADAESHSPEPEDVITAPELPDAAETQTEEELSLSPETVPAEMVTQTPETESRELPGPPEDAASEISADGAGHELPLDKDFRYADTEVRELEIESDEHGEAISDEADFSESPELSDADVLVTDMAEASRDTDPQPSENVAIVPDESFQAEPVPNEDTELPPLEAVIPLPENVPEDPEPAIRYPYTVHVLSYPPDDREKSNRVADRLKNEGKPAIASPSHRPGRTSWHHVLVGFYETSDIAQQAAAELREQNFRSPRVLERPYAVQVGRFESEQEVSQAETELRLKGYMAYKLPSSGSDDKIRLLVGAFETAELANISAENLKADGFETEIVER